jgi:quercetin dioxygenase-like cupin family protein
MMSPTANSRLSLSAKFILALALTAGSPPGAVGAPPLGQGISRADLLRNELNIGTQDAIQARVDFEPGASAVRHRHPGVELVYVLSGTFEYRLDGRPAVTLRAGDTLFIPAGTVHAVRNTGGGKASELATYIVDRTKPLIELVK